MARLGLALVTLVMGCRAEVGDGDVENRVTDAALAVDGPNVVDSAPADAAADARVCAGGDARATAPDGSCIVLFTTPRTWAAASAACTQFGARLVVIDDAGIDQVAAVLAGARDVFIGLTDAAAEGTFAWVDGTPLAFTNWRAGEPNDGNGTFAEDCAIINGVRGGAWDDRPCVTDAVAGVLGEYPYLCQY